jgi:pseudouridine synthase
MKERIQKVLANAGVASRRAIEEMVQQGRISVNGRVVTELPILIDPEKDKIAIDDETVKLKGKSSERRVYLVMNKPKGVYSTNVAQGEQTRAIDLLPPDFPARVYPVGRLDAESKGLLLLTNDGELTNQLTHPRYGIPKTYRAMVDGFVKNELVDEMARGVWLADPKTGKGFKTGRTHVRIVKRSRDKSQLELTLREGRNRQVRRMLARLGHKVRDLTRIKMGPLTLQGLGPGEFRPLTPREVRELREMAQSRAKRHDERKGEQRGGEREQRGGGRRKPRDRDQKH